MNGSSSAADTPRWRDHIVTFYRYDGTIVTTAFVESDGRRYPLVDLTSLRRVEHTSLLQPRAYELWARFRGRLVRLFRSRDPREFGQVCRAVVRAREHAGLT